MPWVKLALHGMNPVNDATFIQKWTNRKRKPMPPQPLPLPCSECLTMDERPFMILRHRGVPMVVHTECCSKAVAHVRKRKELEPEIKSEEATIPPAKIEAMKRLFKLGKSFRGVAQFLRVPQAVAYKVKQQMSEVG